MILTKRKPGSIRSSQPKVLKICDNICDGYLTLQDEDGTYYLLCPESEEEVKKLLSAAHIVHHHFREG